MGDDKMFTAQEFKIIIHCKEIELHSKEIAMIIAMFREKTLKKQTEITEDITRTNDLVDILILLDE